jgi:lipoprotein LpqH
LNRELLIAVAAATLVAGVAGCSHGSKSAPGSATSSATASPAPASPAAPPPGPAVPPAKVTVDGNPLPVTEPVDCNTKDGKFSIAIGQPFIGVIVALEQDASVVHLVGLGEVGGVNLNYTEGAPGDKASATKEGNTYHVTGVASGVDSNGANKTHKPFTIDVTCP